MALSQTAGSFGLMLAPALGGLLMGRFGLRVPLLADAGSYLAIAAAGRLIRTRRGVTRRPVRRTRSEAGPRARDGAQSEAGPRARTGGGYGGIHWSGRRWYWSARWWPRPAC